MKITAVKTCMALHSNRPRNLVKVETDEGIYGWGEAYSIGPDLSVKPIVDYVATWLICTDYRQRAEACSGDH